MRAIDTVLRLSTRYHRRNRYGYTEAPAEHAEHGVFVGDSQVGEQRELEPAGHRVALDGGHQRLLELQARRALRRDKNSRLNCSKYENSKLERLFYFKFSSS